MKAELAQGQARVPRNDRWPAALALLWGLVLLGSMGFLWRYKETPGTDAPVATRWPESRLLVRSDALPTLLVFVHPCCPCTRSTMAQLRGLMPPFAGRVDAAVVTFVPAIPPPDWCGTNEIEELSAACGARVVDDADAGEAARFGVTTSGHVLLYDGSGELRFSGGILAARGHMGDNGGLTALRDALTGALAQDPPNEVIRSPVFGCAIRTP